MQRRRVIVMGAAGRDSHNFNMVFRDNERYEVMAFTATQIPNIEGREYPASLARCLYPKGVPFFRKRSCPHSSGSRRSMKWYFPIPTCPSTTW